MRRLSLALLVITFFLPKISEACGHSPQLQNLASPSDRGSLKVSEANRVRKIAVNYMEDLELTSCYLSLKGRNCSRSFGGQG